MIKFENHNFTQVLVFPGNELSGHGIGAKVDAKLYGKDVVEFKSILRQLYKAPLSQPLLLAPGGFFLSTMVFSATSDFRSWCC